MLGGERTWDRPERIDRVPRADGGLGERDPAAGGDLLDGHREIADHHHPELAAGEQPLRPLEEDVLDRRVADPRRDVAEHPVEAGVAEVAVAEARLRLDVAEAVALGVLPRRLDREGVAIDEGAVRGGVARGDRQPERAVAAAEVEHRRGRALGEMVEQQPGAVVDAIGGEQPGGGDEVKRGAEQLGAHRRSGTHRVALSQAATRFAVQRSSGGCDPRGARRGCSGARRGRAGAARPSGRGAARGCGGRSGRRRRS